MLQFEEEHMIKQASKAFVAELARDLVADYGDQAQSWEFLSDLSQIEDGDIFRDQGNEVRVDWDDLYDALEAV